MKYSEKQLNVIANQIINNIFHLIENKWIRDIYNTYKKVVDETLYKFNCVYNELDQEKNNRLFLELISYALSVIIYLSISAFTIKKRQFLFFKYETDIEGKIFFREVVASFTRDKIIKLKLDHIKEIDLIQIEPKIQFGYSDKNIDFWDRVNKYAAVQYGSTQDKGKDIEIFGKNIGKILDAEHYPVLELIGGYYASDIVKDISCEVKKAFAVID